MAGLRITVTTNAKEYSSAMRIKAGNLEKNIRATGYQVRKVALERADWWSSGENSLADLRRMGHPYARRNTWKAQQSSLKTRKVTTKTVRAKLLGKGFSRGEKFPNRINEQTGDFKGGWKFTYKKTGSGDFLGTLSNTSKHAQYLTRFGTDKMIPRNVMAAINRDVRKETEGLYHDALKRALASGGGSFSGGLGGFGGGGGGGLSAGAMRAAFRRGYSTGAAIGGV